MQLQSYFALIQRARIYLVKYLNIRARIYIQLNIYLVKRLNIYRHIFLRFYFI